MQKKPTKLPRENRKLHVLCGPTLGTRDIKQYFVSFMDTYLCQCLPRNELEKHTQIQHGSCSRNVGELDQVMGGNRSEGGFNFISRI